MKGSIGGAVLTRSFSTAGEEVLSPAVAQKGYAAYVYEEVAASPHAQLQFGARMEHAKFQPAEDEPAADFTNLSGSVGLLLLPNDATTVAFVWRAPAAILRSKSCTSTAPIPATTRSRTAIRVCSQSTPSASTRRSAGAAPRRPAK